MQIEIEEKGKHEENIKRGGRRDVARHGFAGA